MKEDLGSIMSAWIFPYRVSTDILSYLSDMFKRLFFRLSAQKLYKFYIMYYSALLPYDSKTEWFGATLVQG
jgi:hypothetical protein